MTRKSSVQRVYKSALRGLSAVMNGVRDESLQHGIRKALPPVVRTPLRKLALRLTFEAQVASRVDRQTILLADFVRCGIGWIRFTVSTVLHYHRTGEFRKLAHAEMYVYTPTLTGRERPYRPFYFNGGESLLKTHDNFHPSFKRAIVIYRNPFDAIRSMYALDHLEAKGSPYARLAGLSDEESYLVERVREYIGFHETWLTPICAHPDLYLVIEYEEMLGSTEAMLTAIFDFLKIDVTSLPSAGLATLARMYQRTDVTRPLIAEQVGLEEAIRRKLEMFRAIQPVMRRETLHRIDPALEAHLLDVVARMDGVRWRVEEPLAIGSGVADD